MRLKALGTSMNFWSLASPRTKGKKKGLNFIVQGNPKSLKFSCWRSKEPDEDDGHCVQGGPDDPRHDDDLVRLDVPVHLEEIQHRAQQHADRDGGAQGREDARDQHRATQAAQLQSPAGGAALEGELLPGKGLSALPLEPE